MKEIFFSSSNRIRSFDDEYPYDHIDDAFIFCKKWNKKSSSNKIIYFQNSNRLLTNNYVMSYQKILITFWIFDGTSVQFCGFFAHEQKPFGIPSGENKGWKETPKHKRF